MRRALGTGLLAVVFGLTAALVDAEPLWVPAATLALIAAGSAAWVGLGARGVRVRRTLGARRVMEDEPVSILIEVRAGRLGLPPARIADPLLAAPSPLRTGARGGRLRIEARFGRRGRRVLALPRVLIADPLGLATREVSARPSPGDDELLVLPRIEPVVAAPGGGDASRIARRGRPAVGAEVELDGIRPLRDGTPASRIFWPAIARGAEPQERFLTAASESRPVVVLDPRGAAERARRSTPPSARPRRSRGRWPSDGGCQVLLPGDRRPVELGETLAGWPHLHARLALIGPVERARAGQPGPAPRADRLRQRADARARAGRARPGARRDADRRRARAAAVAPRDVRRRRLPRLRAQRAADPRRARTAARRSGAPHERDRAAAARAGPAAAPCRRRPRPPPPPAAPPPAPSAAAGARRAPGRLRRARRARRAAVVAHGRSRPAPDALLGCVLAAAAPATG